MMISPELLVITNTLAASQLSDKFGALVLTKTPVRLRTSGAVEPVSGPALPGRHTETGDIMKNVDLLCHGTLTLISLMLFQPTLADSTSDARTESNAGYPPNFAALCQGDLTPKLQAEFDTNLDTAEKALQTRNLDQAGEALSRAGSAAIRGPNETFYSAALKCQGKTKARRMFLASRDYHLARKAQGEKDIPFWVIVASDGKSGIMNFIQSYDGNQYRRATMSVQTIIDEKERDRDYGAFLLSEEEAMLKACRDALPAMRAHADSKHSAALATEKEAFSRQPTNQEKSIAINSANTGTLLGMAIDSDLLMMGQRVGLSTRSLQDAQDWNFAFDKFGTKAEDDAKWQQLPSSQTAKQRGNTLLAKADDSSISFTSRDAYYDMIIDYYKLGHWNSQLAEAETAKARIQDHVLAEQQQSEQQMLQMQADMEEKAEDMKAALESMQKTEAEKKNFNDEADALEAELGF
jgi:hypothetical protein